MGKNSQEDIVAANRRLNQENS